MPLDRLEVTVVCSFTVPRTCRAVVYRSDFQTAEYQSGSSGTETVGGRPVSWSKMLERKTVPPFAPESTFARTRSVSFRAIRSVPEGTDFQSG